MSEDNLHKVCKEIRLIISMQIVRKFFVSRKLQVLCVFGTIALRPSTRILS